MKLLTEKITRPELMDMAENHPDSRGLGAMNPVHASLAGGRWSTFSLCAQMGNIGSEVERAIIWKRKGNGEYSRKAFYRALELIDLTLRDPKNRGRLREIARVREALADHFEFENEYHSTEAQWQKYFHAFAYAARLGK